MAKLKLKPEMIKKAAELIAAGNYQKTVAQYLGVDPATWYRWLQKGEKQQRGIYRDFYNAVKKAEAEAVARNVAIIQRAAQDSWQAAAWWLERKYPEDWGRRERMQVSGDSTIRIEVVEVGEDYVDQEDSSIS